MDGVTGVSTNNANEPVDDISDLPEGLLSEVFAAAALTAVIPRALEGLAEFEE